MRDYWKSLYGYELPENFGEIYCNVTFGRNDNTFGTDEFCYPIEVSGLLILRCFTKGFHSIWQKLKVLKVAQPHYRDQIHGRPTGVLNP